MILQPWQQLAQAMTSNSSIGILQLVHTGRQSIRCAGRLPFTCPLAPSAIRVSTNPSNLVGKLAEAMVFQTPKAMTQEDIQHVAQQFVKGALLASKAGFHGTELHASHGYLLSSFLSPKTNKRQDAYGGSTEGRLKIVINIIDSVREQCPRPFVVGIKLNSADYMEGGLTEEEALRHVELLTLHGGLDFIEVSPELPTASAESADSKPDIRQISGGSYENLAFLEADAASSSRTNQREAIFAAFASQAKEVALAAASAVENATVPLIMCTGGFRSRAGIERAIKEDGIDLIGIGRPAAADPQWIERLLQPSAYNEKESHVSREDRDKCVEYKVNGGRWLQKLVPLKIVGGGMMTLWHELQMSRMARGQERRVKWSFERLLVVEILQSAMMSLVGIAMFVVALAFIAAKVT